MTAKLTTFQSHPVTYQETMDVKPGVTCDVYAFDGDDTRDLGIIYIERGHTSPLQRVLKGTKTVEGFLSGSGTLTVGRNDGTTEKHSYTQADESQPITVNIGETMQWYAGDTNLAYYEICEPPYEDGRFEDLDEE